MIRLSCFAALLGVCISTALFGQVTELKKIVPPSPIMAPFLRYGDYPVSYATGMANVNIPLYNIKLKDFDFPIDISFHASGRRTNYELSTMGVGWVLNATGFISREIRDRPDELAYHPGLEDSVANISRTNGQLDLLKEYNTLLPADIMVQANSTPSFNYYRDAEHDLYSYDVNGMSGKFIVNDLGYVVPLTAVPYHFNGYAIIIDEKGVKYEFGVSGNEKETTTITHQNSDYLATTGWYLSKITLPSGEIVTFTYGTRYTDAVGNDNVQAAYDESYQLTYSNPNTANFALIHGAIMDNYSANLTEIRENNIINSRRSYTIKYITSINFGNGKVNFNYDLTNLRLTDIEVMDATGNQIKRADFTYMQTPGTLGYLPNNNSTSLASLTMDGGKYTFNYYDNPLTSSNDYQAFYNNKDWWGYSNVAGNKIPVNPNPDPNNYEDIAVYQRGCTTCKLPNFLNKVSGMLKSIIYPTGGNTEFSYESNMYNYGIPTNPLIEGPGIRIAKIASDDGTGNKITKVYKYGTLVNGLENGAGTLLYAPKPADFKSVFTQVVYESTANGATINPPAFGGFYIMSTYKKSPVQTLAEAYQLPVYYSTVTEYTQSGSGINNGKTVYEYSIPQSVMGTSGTIGLQSFTTKNWTAPKLYNKTSYQYRNAQNDYQPVQWDHNEYATIAYSKIQQMRFKRRWQINGDNSYSDRTRDLYIAGLSGLTPPVNMGIPYEVTDWPIESAAQLPSKQLSTTYVNGIPALTTETDLFYGNPVHLQPTRTETFTSKSDEKLITQTSYVQDYTSPGTATAIQQGIANFKNRFMIAPVEISQYRSPLSGTPKRLISSQRFTFNPTQPVMDSILTLNVTSPITNFVPLSINTSGVLTKDGRYAKKINFDSYDSQANLLQQHIENNLPHSYIWGYNKQYPIAEVIGAAVTDIWYEGFEETGGGLQSIPGKMGNKVKTGGYSKSLTGLTNGKYRLTYWHYVSNAWSQVVLDNIDVSAGTYTINIGSSEIVDELRFYPKGAQMTTYMYAPLVGLTAVMDPKGTVNYYSYDTYNRLKSIKDESGSIIKSYEYHYKP